MNQPCPGITGQGRFFCQSTKSSMEDCHSLGWRVSLKSSTSPSSASSLVETTVVRVAEPMLSLSMFTLAEERLLYW